MTERLQPTVPAIERRAGGRRGPGRRVSGRAERSPPSPALDGPRRDRSRRSSGFPAEEIGGRRPGATWRVDAGPRHPPLPPCPGRSLKRADRVGAGALVLAGVAANVSLLLSWAPGEGPAGLALVQRGVEALGSGAAGPADSGLWQPLVVVVERRPPGRSRPAAARPRAGPSAGRGARADRPLAAAAAVILLMADTGWRSTGSAPVMWCAVAVPVLGLLGSLKAMLSAPLVALAPSSSSLRPRRRPLPRASRVRHRRRSVS